MNPWVKRKWVKALRSGEYIQTQNSLYDYNGTDKPGGYCCLAVLLAEMKPDAFVEEAKTMWTRPSIEVRSTEAEGSIADDLAIMWGLDQANQFTLVQLNDDDGKDFNEIADFIEDNL